MIWELRGRLPAAPLCLLGVAVTQEDDVSYSPARNLLLLKSQASPLQ